MAAEQAQEASKEKTFTIIINGQAKQVAGKELTFEQIVALAFSSAATDGNTIFSVTYRRGHGDKPEGTLVAGETVKIKEGEIFNVSETNRS